MNRSATTRVVMLGLGIAVVATAGVIYYLSTLDPRGGQREALLSEPDLVTIPVAVDQATFQLWHTTDDPAVIDAFIERDQVFNVDNPTRVHVLKTIPGRASIPAAQVEILTGPQAGRQG